MRHIIVITLFLGITLQVHSQGFQHLNVEDGLSSHVVYSLQRHHNGMMWFSTKVGIDRFDGSRFKHYRLYDNQRLFEHGLRHTKLYEDRNDELWVYNIRDVFLYNKLLDRFDLYHSSPTSHAIRDLLVTPNGKIIMATDGGLVQIDQRTKAVEHIADVTMPLVNLVLYRNDLLLAASRNGLYVFDFQQELLRDDVFAVSLRQEFRNKHITAIAVDQRQNIFIGYQGEIAVFNQYSTSLTVSTELNKHFANCAIRRILVDPRLGILVGTDGAGAFLIDADLRLRQAFVSDQHDPATIPDNSVSDIFVDPDDRIWIVGRGLSYHDPNRQKFQTYEHLPNNPNSLIHKSVRAIAEDDNGDLWFGTKYGISVYQRKTGHWRHITQAVSGGRLGTDKILSLKRDPGGNILAGTYQHGLFDISRDGAITHSHSQMSIYAMKIDSNELLLGGPTGLVRIDRHTGKSTRLPLNHVFSITSHPRLGILAGGHSGLTVVDHKGGVATYNAVTHEIGSIFAVITDHQGRVWCASEGQGLLQFLDSTRTFKKYTTADGLPSDLVYSILEDRQGKLWLSTNDGLSCFDPEKEEFRNFSLADGLNIKEFNHGASVLTQNGELVFGGISGFVIFKPEDIVATDIQPHLVFTDLKLFNETVPVGGEDTPLSKIIDETDTLRLRYNQNAIQLEFISVNYTHPHKTQYRWILEGMDKNWTPASTEHAATYTNLKPGEYTFRVQSINDNLRTAESTRSITILISPPFWKTSWAYLLYLAVGALITYAAVRLYHIRVSERHAKDKIRFFTNLAHDIRTPLSLILSPLSLALRRNDFSRDTHQALKTAAHNSQRLSQMINQLLDFEKAELNKMELRLSQFHAEGVLDELCDNFIPFVNEKSILFTRDFKQRHTLLCADRDKFDKIVFNLLSNAIKYTPAGGQISVRTDVRGTRFLIEVADTGFGIPENQHDRIFEHYFRASNAVNANVVGCGIGLMLSKRLVEMHGGTIAFESSEGQGSTFRVYLPLTLVCTAPVEVEPAYAHPFPAEEDKASSKKPTLLIAEDHRELSEHLVENLSDDFRIFTAADGAQALALAGSVYPDLILSDVMMPIMNGNELCFRIKNNIETSHIPVILLTSLSSTQHKIDGMKTGADLYMEKPFDIELLKTSLASILQNKNRIKEKFLRNEHFEDEGLSALDRSFISKITTIVDENLSNASFSIDQLEKEIGMSHAALYRKFKTLMGKTPLDFIHEIRLKKAVELLSQGGYQVNEVAYMVGYSDPKYFSTVFKKFFGKTASSFLPTSVGES